MHDHLGIADGFHDVAGRWHPTPEATRAYLHAAMGQPDAAAPMWFLSTADAPDHPLDSPCELELESGERVGEVSALPHDLPIGYHTLHPHDGGPSTWLVVSPPRCPEAPAGWGVAAQVYALWRSDGWGIGDLRDVAELGALVAGRGGVALLLSPLHAPAPTFPQEASPYYPSSRRWLSPLLVATDGRPEAAVDNRPGQLIDRDAVWAAKRAHLETRFAAESAGAEWREWVAAQGEDLELFTVWNALADVHGSRWRAWPERLRHPSSAALDELRRTDEALRDRAAFHAWCQWQAHLQLKSAAAESPCGLIGDLAVGCSPHGADAWLHQDLLAPGCHIGAPPDPFNEDGQDWGLPPFVPWRLRRARYEPFVRMLRSGFSAVAGLRIDHVMGMFRQFWIPEGAGPAAGAYVELPGAEMMALLRVEATRAACYVVGEDLGTVQPEVRSALAASSVMGTRVWWFDHASPDWPEPNLATATTHDLPTLAGVWTGSDGTDEMAAALRTVAPDASSLAEVAALVHADVVSKGSRLVLATVDDLAGATERPNHPGTLADQQPNWRRRMPAASAAIIDGEVGAAIVGALRDGAQPRVSSERTGTSGS